MLTVVNRVLLTLLGLALLAGGAVCLIGGLDLERRWGFTLPAGWPLDDPHQALLSKASRTRWLEQGWWWPAVFGVLSGIFLASLWWLLAQLRVGRLRRVEVDTGDGELALLRGRALEDVLAADVSALAGVDRAAVVLRGRRQAPNVRITLALAPHAEPRELVADLYRRVLGDARDSVGMVALPAEVRMGGDRHPARRVE